MPIPCLSKMRITWVCLPCINYEVGLVVVIRIAYAYLMYRPDKSLTEVSEKEIRSYQGFTELGSGFKIAMRDLSIRGAGNLLGSSQSGFIDSVGFELYSQLLEEIAKEKWN